MKRPVTSHGGHGHPRNVNNTNSLHLEMPGNHFDMSELIMHSDRLKDVICQDSSCHPEQRMHRH
jgi:hypothetical protein